VAEITVTATVQPPQTVIVFDCDPNDPSCGEPDDNNAPAANNGPVVVKNPCQLQGRALSPSDYATSGQQAANSTTNFVLDVSMGFPAGHYLDPQPLASGNVFQRQAYGNYTFGVYMAGAGVSPNTALSGANTYAFFFSSYPKSTPMDPNYGSLPAANLVSRISGTGTTPTRTAPYATTRGDSNEANDARAFLELQADSAASLWSLPSPFRLRKIANTLVDGVPISRRKSDRQCVYGRDRQEFVNSE